MLLLSVILWGVSGFRFFGKPILMFMKAPKTRVDLLLPGPRQSLSLILGFPGLGPLGPLEV